MEKLKEKNQILNQNQINRIVKRIAYQIHEKNNEESHIYLVGIYKNGYTLADLISKELKKISKSNIKLCSLKINKKNPLKNIELNYKLKEFINENGNKGKFIDFFKFLDDEWEMNPYDSFGLILNSVGIDEKSVEFVYGDNIDNVVYDENGDIICWYQYSENFKEIRNRMPRISIQI